jgi:hypothetical protein
MIANARMSVIAAGALGRLDDTRRPPATADGRLARAEVRARLARQVARARRRWRRPRSGRRAGEPFL